MDFTGNVAAIDFGTTFCSLSYQVSGWDRSTLRIDDTRDRVPSALFVKKEGATIKVVDIGYSAQTQYKKLPKEKYKEYLYFECFKMQLRDENNLSRKSIISAFAGENYYLFEVIALLLQHLRAEFENHLSIASYEIHDSESRKLKATDFHWVLTVPAIWKNRGKQMMREAAYKAGLLGEVPPITTLTSTSTVLPPQALAVPNIPSAAMQKLVLALEPECAALYCRQMTDDNLIAGHCDRPCVIASKCYMVLDIGGGTVDIAIHTVEGDSTIRSVLPPTGNDCGGTKVNNEFSALLQEMLGDSNFKIFCSCPKDKVAYHKAIITNLINHEFEFSKVQFGKKILSLASGTDDMVYIRLDSSLVKFYEKQLTKDAACDFGIEYDDDDTICISYSKMEELFQPAIDGILSCMNSALEASPVSVDTIYLVGGFGGCPYIYKKIKDEIEKKRKNVSIIVPIHYRTAVVEGAVIYRQKLTSIISRVSDAYYGIETIAKYEYKPSEHDESRCRQEDDHYIVEHWFNVFIKKNQVVKVDDKFENTLHPLESDQAIGTIPIYRTTNDGVKYVKDVDGKLTPGVEQLGELFIDAPICNLPVSERNIDVEFMIGGTEIQVKAVYGPTGKEVDAKLDVL